MQNIKSAYAAALGGPPSAGPTPSQDDNKPPIPKTPEDSDPRTQQGATFFLDPAMLPEGHKCKKGDEFLLKVRVGSIGSKIALTPLEVVLHNDEEDDTYATADEEASESSGERGMPGYDNERRS